MSKDGKQRSLYSLMYSLGDIPYSASKALVKYDALEYPT